ncbi:hypothetical protein J6590_091159, partial [Homalodisca vitripennis]
RDRFPMDSSHDVKGCLNTVHGRAVLVLVSSCCERVVTFSDEGKLPCTQRAISVAQNLLLALCYPFFNRNDTVDHAFLFRSAIGLIFRHQIPVALEFLSSNQLVCDIKIESAGNTYPNQMPVTEVIEV